MCMLLASQKTTCTLIIIGYNKPNTNKWIISRRCPLGKRNRSTWRLHTGWLLNPRIRRATHDPPLLRPRIQIEKATKVSLVGSGRWWPIAWRKRDADQADGGDRFETCVPRPWNRPKIGDHASARKGQATENRRTERSNHEPPTSSEHVATNLY